MKALMLEKKFNINLHLIFIYLYIFITPWHVSNSQTSVLSIILLFWTIIKYKKEILFKLKEYAIFSPVFLLFSFILYSYISTFWSNTFKDGFIYVNTFTKYYFFIIPAILASLNKENAIKAIKILTLSFGLYAIYSLSIYFGFIEIKGASINNPQGHLRHLIISQYMALSFFISFFIFYLSENKSEKVLFIIVALLSFFTLFINNSRTAQLSFLLVMAIFMVTVFRKYLLNIKVVFFVSIFFILGVYTLYENNKFSKFEKGYKEFLHAIENDKLSGSLGARLYFNKVGVEILGDNFIFGIGPNDNRILLQKIQKEDSNYFGDNKIGDNRKGRIINHFHSEHMDKLTAYGILGYSLLFFSIVFLIYKLKDDKLNYYIGLSVFLTLFFNSLANKTLSIKPLTYVYIVFFILLAIIAYNKDKNLEKKN